MGREKQTEPTEVGGLECDREEFGGLDGNSIDIFGQVLGSQYKDLEVGIVLQNNWLQMAQVLMPTAQKSMFLINLWTSPFSHFLLVSK